MEADDERVSPISRRERERDRGEIHECMKFSTDFRRLIWPLIRTAQGKIGILEGRETGRPAETSERDKTKISTPMVGVKRQLLPVLKLHVVLSPKKWPVCGWVRFVSALVLVLFWYSAWTCLGPVNKPY